MPRVQVIYESSSNGEISGGFNPYYQGYSFGNTGSGRGGFGGGSSIMDYLNKQIGGGGSIVEVGGGSGGYSGGNTSGYTSGTIDSNRPSFNDASRERRSEPQEPAAPAAARDPGPPRSLHYQARNANQGEDFYAKLEDQKMSGSLYEDPDFPADRSSIYPSRMSSFYEWKRPKDLCRDPMFISDGADRFDVKQGELGDCWLLAAIASLSMHRNLFEKVVPLDQDFGDNYCGMFRFRLWQFGEWRDVVIDDRLPTKNGRLCFMKSQDRNEFWSALLEKAYAKLNGSYEALSGGNQAEAMEDFTGGLCETIDLTSAPPDLFEILFKANQSQSLMGCSIESDQIEGFLSNGLITGHAYSVTDVRRCRMSNGDQERLIRVRNPWGNECEWKGAWSDSSPKWRDVDYDEKKRLEITDRDDGEFWMAFEDFKNEFNKLEVCHLGPESMSGGVDDETAKKRRWELCIETGEWKRNTTAGGCRNFIDTFARNPQFRVEIVDPDEDDDENLGTIIVGVMQKDVRKLTKGGDFLTIGYAIYAIKDPNCGPLDQSFFRFNRHSDRSPSFVNQREVSGRHKLPPGNYVIVPSTFNPNEEAEFILRIFSERPNESSVLDSKNGMEDMVECIYGRKTKSSVMENEAPLRKAFDQFAGPAAKIHAKQLQQILNQSLSREIKDFNGFSLESCRSMLALVDANMSGYMEFDEFKLLWNEVRLLKTIYKDHDADGNGYFDAFELRDALRTAGYNLCNKVFEAIAMRYMDPEEGSVSFEDFILLAIRLKIAFETYDTMPKTQENFGVIKQDHFLLQTLYL